MRGKLPILALFMLSFLFLFAGCIYSGQENLANSLKTSTYMPVDVDGNGQMDLFTVGFSPVTFQAGQTSVTITRFLYIYPIDGTVDARKDTLTNDTIAFLKTLTSNLDDDITKADVDCRSKLNFDLCTSPQNCYNACSDPQTCKQEGIGPIIWDYKQLMTARDEDMRALTLLASALKAGDSLKDYSDRLTRLVVEISAMENHPLIKEIRFCHFSMGTTPLMVYTGVYYPSEREALVGTSILGEHVGSAGVELNLKERIDDAIDSNVESYAFYNGIQELGAHPATLAYPSIRLSHDGKVYFVYTAKGSLSRTSTPFELWNNIDMGVKIVTVDLSWLNHALKDIEDMLYMPLLVQTSDPKLALGLSLAVLWFLFALAYGITVYVVRFVKILRMNKPVGYATKKAFGFASPSWRWDFVIGLLLFGAGYALDLFLSTNVPLPKLDSKSLTTFASKDIAGSIGIILIFASSFFLSSSILDRLKRLLAGSEYDEMEAQATPEKNELLWKELKRIVEEGQEEIKDYSQQEMDVGQALSKLMNIPLDRLRESIYNEPNQAKVMRELKRYKEMALDIIDSVKSKARLAKTNKEEWLAYIDKKLSKVDQLPLSALISIPIEWRLWAAKEYIKTYPEKFVELDGVMLVKRKLTPEQKAQRFVEYVEKEAEGSVKGAFVLKGGKILTEKLGMPVKKTLLNNLLSIFADSMTTAGSFKSIVMFKSLLLYTEKLDGQLVLFLIERDDIEKVADIIDKYAKILKV